MSQKQHRKQVDRARTKRRASKLDRRRARNRVIIIVMVFLMAFSLVAGAVAGLFAGTDDTAAPPEAADEPDAPDPVEPDPLVDPDDPPFDIVAQPGDAPRATVETDRGPIVLSLDPAEAPLAVNSMISLAEEGFYDGIVFHRVIDGFVIQGGDPTGTGAGGPGYRFPDELDAAEELVASAGGYPRGTLAMANAGPDTNGSQFFIVQGEMVELPPAYTVFGEVVEGMDVVDAIATSETGPADRPVEPIEITEVSVELD